MTPDSIVYQTLLTSGIPGTKVAYQEGQAPPLPWFVYFRRRGGNLYADGTNWTNIPRYRAELYQRENDPEIRERFEEAIAQLGPYTSYESWIETESCMMTVYDFTYHPDLD